MIHTDLKPENVILNLEKKDLEEIWKRGYLTTPNIFSLPESIKNRLDFNVYDSKNRLSDKEKKAKAKKEKRKRANQRKKAKKRRDKWIAAGLDPVVEEEKW